MEDLCVDNLTNDTTEEEKLALLGLDSTRFFYISNIFISNTRLKLAKNQAYAKQHTEAEVVLFEHYARSSSTLSSKNNRT